MLIVSPRYLCEISGSNNFVPSHRRAGIFGFSTFSRNKARIAPAEMSTVRERNHFNANFPC